MVQEINSKLWKEFEIEKKNLEKKVLPGRINNAATFSNIPQGRFMEKVCSRINISDIAQEHSIDTCPICEKYQVNFNDLRGWFCCQNPGCKFRGNIVDFFKFIEDLK